MHGFAPSKKLSVVGEIGEKLFRVAIRLRVSNEVRFVFLRGDYALIEKQLRSRRRHFMKPDLLQSQFDDLEEPQPDEHALTIAMGRTPEEIVEEMEAKLHLAGSA